MIDDNINAALDRGFDSGNYASAYVSEDFDAAKEHAQDEDHNEPFVGEDAPASVSEAWEAGFIIGFYSSYETHEVWSDDREELIDATIKWGARMREIGIAVDDRSWDELDVL